MWFEGPTPDGATLTVRLTLGAGDALAEVLRRLVRADVDVLACETGELSLEEIYIQTLGPVPAPNHGAVPVVAR